MFKVKRSKIWKKTTPTLLVVNGRATTQISSPHKTILTGGLKFQAQIEASVIQNTTVFHLTTRKGNYVKQKAFTININVDNPGTYNITFDMKCGFGYNGSSSGPYNSSYGFELIMDDSKTIWKLARTWADNSWFSGYMIAGNPANVNKWKTLCTVDLSLTKGNHKFDFYVEQQDRRNKHCETYISVFRATVND